MTHLSFRQIHLDFHTSELIPDLGYDFNGTEFAETLKKAHVNSITCFSRCHHGMIYHETKKFPERKHPALKQNLLHEQIEACHKLGIKVPIYITVQWDYFTSKLHPEWLQRDADNRIMGTRPFDAGFYNHFCLNTPYTDFIEEQTSEVLDMFDVDGIFYDIMNITPCCCEFCVKDMKKAGMNPENPSERYQFAVNTILRFQERMYGLIKSQHPNATVFFNSGHIGTHHRVIAHTYSHYELESLPSGGWGYLHFPTAQRFARNLDKQTLGMTGKFHTTWGDFHSLKNLPALEFECMNMLSLGARCSVGDQLHPRGVLDKATYDLIGKVYEKVEKAEPWCVNAAPLSEIGLMTPEEFQTGQAHNTLSPAVLGAVRMLQELQYQFDIIDTKCDFSKYKVIILPDVIPMNETMGSKLTQFISNGGKVVASYRSGLNENGNAFKLKEFGARYVGNAPYSPDFINPDALGCGLLDSIYVMYQQGSEVEPQAGTEILCKVTQPYFNRTWEHFVSHRQTPSDKLASYPGVIQNGNVIYFAHQVFGEYNETASLWVKRIIANAIKRLLPERIICIEGPSSLLVTVNEQKTENRLVAHVLCYIPERRCNRFDVIEDIIPLYKLKTSVLIEKPVKKVTLEPTGVELPFSQSNGKIEFTIPELRGHQMVVITF